MEQKDQNKVGMAKAVRECLQNNKTIVSGNTILTRYAAELDAVLADANKAISGQTGTSSGITDDKDALELKAVDAVVSIGSAAKSYALDLENNTLFAAVNYGKDALLHTPQNELPQRLKSILDAAHGQATALKDFGVEESDFTAAYDLVTAFGKATPAPRATIAQKAAVTQSVPVIMKALRTVLLKMDALVERLKVKYPEFAATYKASRVVVDAGVRHHDKAAATT